MMYLKFTDEDGNVKNEEIYGDQIYTRCPKCGEEIQIDFDFLLNIFIDDGDFSSSITHSECFEKYPKLVRVK